jgi:hypothetical protein
MGTGTLAGTVTVGGAAGGGWVEGMTTSVVHLWLEGPWLASPAKTTRKKRLRIPREPVAPTRVLKTNDPSDFRARRVNVLHLPDPAGRDWTRT